MVHEKSLDRWLRKAVKQRGGVCIRLQCTRGVPAQLVLLPSGRAIFIELKTPTGVVAPMQAHWLRRLTRLGFEAGYARDKKGLYGLLGGDA